MVFTLNLNPKRLPDLPFPAFVALLNIDVAPRDGGKRVTHPVILDTGSDLTALRPDLVSSLRLPRVGKMRVNTAATSYRTSLCESQLIFRWVPTATRSVDTVVALLPDAKLDFMAWLRAIPRRLLGKRRERMGLLALRDVLPRFEVRMRFDGTGQPILELSPR